MTEVGVNHRRIEITLFLIALLTFAYFYQASDQSTAARFDLMRAIIEERTLNIDHYGGYNTADIIHLRGHYYSVKAPGGTLTGLVPWAIVTAALHPMLAHHYGWYWALATWFAIILSTSLLVAILTVILYRCAIYLGASAGRAAALALILAFATIMFPYATEMTGEPIAGVCLFAAFYLLIAFRENPDVERALLAGLLTGWAVLCDFPSMIVAIPLALYALFKLPRFKDIAAFAVGAFAIAVLLGVYNDLAFGHPLFLSYQAYKLAGNTQFPEQARGFVGLTYPKPWILWKVLIDPQRGLFFCNPVLVLIIPGLVAFWRRREYRAEFAVTIIAVVGFILFNASFGASIVSWGGGTATGPRQMCAAIPFMVLTLAFLPEGWNYLMGALALASAFMMLMATAVEPHLPYEYATPFRDFLMPAYARGDFGYNAGTYYGGPTLFGHSTAFNVGKLAGLPGWLQLWPLGFLWVAASADLLAELRPWRDGVLRRWGGAAAVITILALFVPSTLGAATRQTDLLARHGLLGAYYRGFNPDGYPPHIVRIDPQIDFPDIAALGALPPHSCVLWRGELFIKRPGLYRFRIVADDAGWLTIDGRAVIADPGNVTRTYGSGKIFMEAGLHRIQVGERNIWGNSAMFLYWTPPSGREQLVPSDVLMPPPTIGAAPRNLALQRSPRTPTSPPRNGS